MTTNAQHFDVAVIGGGSGLTAAYHALQDGKSVALVDPQPDALGGTCVYRGCQPTKLMTHAADVLETIRHAEHANVQVDQSTVSPDFPGLMRHVREQRSDHSSSVKDWVESEMTPFYGRAHFTGDRILELDDGRALTADRVFVATGARPAIPRIEGLDDADYLTNESILELERLPKSLAILGGGYIGCEFAHVFAAMGCDVTIIDHSGLLPREDADVRELFEAELRKRTDVMLHYEAVKVESLDSGSRGVRTRENGRPAGVKLTLRNDHDADEFVEAEALLVALGRTPNTDTLDLDAAGIDADKNGYIKVDERLETTCPGVFAYGDCIGKAMFKHTSSYEGELAYRNANGAEQRADYHANPHAVYSKPQVAAVGLTEEQCQDRGLNYETASVPFHKFAKGEILGEPAGLAKLITEAGSDRILGFHLAGPGAAVMIHEVVVAMNCGNGSAKRIKDAIHIHPSTPELIGKTFAQV